MSNDIELKLQFNLSDGTSQTATAIIPGGKDGKDGQGGSTAEPMCIRGGSYPNRLSAEGTCSLVGGDTTLSFAPKDNTLRNNVITTGGGSLIRAAQAGDPQTPSGYVMSVPPGFADQIKAVYGVEPLDNGTYAFEVRTHWHAEFSLYRGNDLDEFRKTYLVQYPLQQATVLLGNLPITGEVLPVPAYVINALQEPLNYLSQGRSTRLFENMPQGGQTFEISLNPSDEAHFVLLYTTEMIVCGNKGDEPVVNPI